MTHFSPHGTVHGNGGALAAYVADAFAAEDKRVRDALDDTLRRERDLRAKRRAMRERRRVT